MADKTVKEVAFKVNASGTAPGFFAQLGEQVKNLKKQTGEESVLGSLGKIALGSGAIAGIGLIARTAADATERAKELFEQFAAGKMTASQVADQLARSIPILGEIYRAGRNLREMFDGTAKDNAFLEATKQQAKFIEDSIAGQKALAAEAKKTAAEFRSMGEDARDRMNVAAAGSAPAPGGDVARVGVEFAISQRKNSEAADDAIKKLEADSAAEIKKLEDAQKKFMGVDRPSEKELASLNGPVSKTLIGNPELDRQRIRDRESAYQAAVGKYNELQRQIRDQEDALKSGKLTVAQGLSGATNALGNEAMGKQRSAIKQFEDAAAAKLKEQSAAALDNLDHALTDVLEERRKIKESLDELMKANAKGQAELNAQSLENVNKQYEAGVVRRRQQAVEETEAIKKNFEEIRRTAGYTQVDIEKAKASADQANRLVAKRLKADVDGLTKDREKDLIGEITQRMSEASRGATASVVSGGTGVVAQSLERGSDTLTSLMQQQVEAVRKLVDPIKTLPDLVAELIRLTKNTPTLKLPPYTPGK